MNESDSDKILAVEEGGIFYSIRDVYDMIKGHEEIAKHGQLRKEQQIILDALNAWAFLMVEGCEAEILKK